MMMIVMGAVGALVLRRKGTSGGRGSTKFCVDPDMCVGEGVSRSQDLVTQGHNK